MTYIRCIIKLLIGRYIVWLIITYYDVINDKKAENFLDLVYDVISRHISQKKNFTLSIFLKITKLVFGDANWSAKGADKLILICVSAQRVSGYAIVYATRVKFNGSWHSHWISWNNANILATLLAVINVVYKSGLKL